jgi:hypothetical protein
VRAGPHHPADRTREWFRTKPGGTNSAQGFIQSLGEDEGILYADVYIPAVRRFPGYFYRTTNP